MCTLPGRSWQTRNTTAPYPDISRIAFSTTSLVEAMTISHDTDFPSSMLAVAHTCLDDHTPSNLCAPKSSSHTLMVQEPELHPDSHTDWLCLILYLCISFHIIWQTSWPGREPGYIGCLIACYVYVNNHRQDKTVPWYHEMINRLVLNVTSN